MKYLKYLQILFLAGAVCVATCKAEEPLQKELPQPSSLAALLSGEIESLEIGQIPAFASPNTAQTANQILENYCHIKTTNREQIEGFINYLKRVPIVRSVSTRRYEFRGLIKTIDHDGTEKIITFGSLFSNNNWIEAGLRTDRFEIYKNLLPTIQAWQDEFNTNYSKEMSCRYRENHK